jgi:hypothetical protein
VALRKAPPWALAVLRHRDRVAQGAGDSWRLVPLTTVGEEDAWLWGAVCYLERSLRAALCEAASDKGGGGQEL